MAGPVPCILTFLPGRTRYDEGIPTSSFKGDRPIMKKTFLVLALMAALRSASGQPALKDVFQNDFLIGAALNASQFDAPDSRAAALVKQQFNAISPENVLKWGPVHPAPGQFNFAAADRYVAFGESNRLAVIGHTLVWHGQTPDWVFQDGQGRPVRRDVLLQRMREHIFAVVGRYRGRIKGWDVVNEALQDDGSLRPTPWLKILGEDYLLEAYRFAHEADPAAELYYNDYALENRAKRNGALALVKRLQAGGIPLAAVGLQGHYTLQSPHISELDATITAFARLGVKVNITELDVDVLPDGAKDLKLSAKSNPYTNGLPDQMQQKLAERYAELFGVFLQHRHEIDRVTLWGVTDGDSWLNYFPVQGRTNYPLLFDRQGHPKPALAAVVRQALGSGNR